MLIYLDQLNGHLTFLTILYQASLERASRASQDLCLVFQLTHNSYTGAFQRAITHTEPACVGYYRCLHTLSRYLHLVMHHIELSGSAFLPFAICTIWIISDVEDISISTKHMPLKSQEFFYIVFKLFESTDHESINFTPYQFQAKFFDCVLYIYLWRN